MSVVINLLVKLNEVVKVLYEAKHKMCDTTLYSRWRGMRARCNNKNNEHYNNYGGRGISVCKEWDDFMLFQDWALANGYNDTLTLDRKNNNLGYNPDNCRWVTQVEQNNNQSKTIHVTYNGITDTISGWSNRTGIKHKTLGKAHREGRIEKMLGGVIDGKT